VAAKQTQGGNPPEGATASTVVVIDRHREDREIGTIGFAPLGRDLLFRCAAGDRGAEVFVPACSLLL
jgi:hypothetical protein